MAKAKSRKRTATRSAPTVVVREAPRAPQSIVIARSAPPARRASRGSSSLFSRARGAGSSIMGAVPVKETLEGGGGGVLAGLVDDVLPAKWATSKPGRAALVFTSCALLARFTGMPMLVLAGAAGGVARKLYDDITE